MKKLDNQITTETTTQTDELSQASRPSLFGGPVDHDIEILGDIVSPIYADWVKLCSS